MRALALAALMLCVHPAASAEDKGTGASAWIPLFNGKDLTGWTPKFAGHPLGKNVAHTFSVDGGLLTVSYDGYEKFGGEFGHLFHERAFSSYRLRAEYRFVGKQVKGAPGWAFRNSGLMIHGQSPQSMSLEQKFPVSIEVQLLGGRGEGERPTANLCTPGTHVVLDGALCRKHCVNSASKTCHGDGWVRAEVEVQGPRIRHFVDGVPVLVYRDPQLDEDDPDAKRLLAAGHPKMLRRGSISLQAESHPVQFRKIEILELPDEPTWTELLGSDLGTGWETTGNWTLADGVVTLTPRDGEHGWTRYDAYLWCRTAPFEDFEATFEYRVKKKSNSGFYFHVGDKADPIRTGLEVQIFDSFGKDKDLNDHDSGGVIPGIPPQKNATKPPGEWNHFRIWCRDRHLVVELNDVVVNRVALDRYPNRPKRGFIGFQDHALPLSLRNIRIRRL